jgi:hypothetical protein
MSSYNSVTPSVSITSLAHVVASRKIDGLLLKDNGLLATLCHNRIVEEQDVPDVRGTRMRRH